MSLMGHAPFFFNTKERMVIAFGRLFDGIHIERSNGTTNQLVRVPLTYAPKNKLLFRADQDPDNLKTAAIELPHMAFEVASDFIYDGDRKLPPLERLVNLDTADANKFKRQYVPVPYNLHFNLYVYVNHISDGAKIVEQILPFFTPDWTLSLQFIPEVGLNLDVPIILQSVSMDDNHWDGAFTQRRVLVWTLSFVMKTYFFGPIKSKPIIKFAYERFVIDPAGSEEISNGDILAQVLVQPGMMANGSPTSNAALSVDANTIYATNTYGYVETYSANGNIAWE